VPIVGRGRRGKRCGGVGDEAQMGEVSEGQSSKKGSREGGAGGEKALSWREAGVVRKKARRVVVKKKTGHASLSEAVGGDLGRARWDQQ